MRAVILAGGSGTRLWPLSRSQMPKQFLPLVGEGSLFQETVERVRPLVDDDVCVVTTEETRFLVGTELAGSAQPCRTCTTGYGGLWRQNDHPILP